MSNVLLSVELLVSILLATVEKWSFNWSTEILKFTCGFERDALFVS